MTKTSEYDFSVPAELIAHQPTVERDCSRLMVLDRAKRSVNHRSFFHLIDYLKSGDLLVLNNTKVMPANLVGRKEESGAKVEVLLVNGKRGMGKGKQVWECLVKPGKRLNIGSKVVFGNDEVIGTVLEKTASGEQIIEFEGDLQGFMRRQGEIPLPPYIKKEVSSKEIGVRRKERYQTVYAKKEGASAAPTAGLHFTPELLDKIKAKGVNIAYVTLHTGLATFKPIYAERIEDHEMYRESFEVPPETISALKKAKRVIAVGTTSVRTLETIGKNGVLGLPDRRIIGSTDLFIYPGFKFKVIDAMITNFHWPRTSLVVLVSAFAGKDFIMEAYQAAIREKYRFFSFGDAMIIL
jgi:S-adenosylmethionine:tRNA ribosyltransferase-isomerase